MKLSGQAFVLVQKLRHEVLTARDDQRTIDPYITVKQARALLKWIDKHQETP